MSHKGLDCTPICKQYRLGFYQGITRYKKSISALSRVNDIIPKRDNITDNSFWKAKISHGFYFCPYRTWLVCCIMGSVEKYWGFFLLIDYSWAWWGCRYNRLRNKCFVQICGRCDCKSICLDEKNDFHLRREAVLLCTNLNVMVE